MLDLSLATSLAGCAFESYSDPSRIVGVPQRSHGDTVVSYMSTSFVREAFTGAVEVFLMGCRAGEEGTCSFCQHSWTVTVSTGPDHRNGSVILSVPTNKYDGTTTEPAVIYLHEPSETQLFVFVYDTYTNKHETTRAWTNPFSLFRKANTHHKHYLGKSDGVQIQRNNVDENEKKRKVTVDVFAEEQESLNVHGFSRQNKIGSVDLEINLRHFPKCKGKEMKALSLVERPFRWVPPAIMYPSTYYTFAKEVLRWAWARLFLIKEWKLLMHEADRRTSWEPVAFLNNSKLDTQAWVYRDKDKEEMVIAFRGTEGIKLLDIITNLNLRQAPLGFLPSTAVTGGKADELVKLHGHEARAHSGFVESYEALRPYIIKLIEQINPATVYCTGHSLGGAIATVCALHLATTTESESSRKKRVIMSNFGSPRVGNAAFAALFNEVIAGSKRWKTNDDIVTMLPAETIHDQHFFHVMNKIENDELETEHRHAWSWEDHKEVARNRDGDHHLECGIIGMVYDIVRHAVSGKFWNHMPISYYLDLCHRIRSWQSDMVTSVSLI